MAVSNIVTGDAVVLDLRPARVPTRMMAALIDLTVQGTLLWLSILLILDIVNRDATIDNASLTVVYALLTITIFVLLPLIIETATCGRGLGKWAMGLRVVRDDGGTTGFRHALIRVLSFWLLDFSFYTACTAGLAAATLSPQGKRVGDLLAGTVVIRTRPPRTTRPVPAGEPCYAPWAAQLEMSRLNDELLAAARYVLSRDHLMRPRFRQSMMSYLAAEISRRTAPPPPTDMSPEAFITTVLAEQRRRSVARQTQQRRPAAPPG